MSLRRMLILIALAMAVCMAVGLCHSDPEPLPPDAVAGDGPVVTGLAGTLPAVEAATMPATTSTSPSEARSEIADGTVAAELAHDATGFRGRVVTAERLPVRGIQVQLLRFAPEVALEVGRDPFTLGAANPRVVAAADATDGDGRFELLGIAPRGICCLRLSFTDPAAAPPPLRAAHGTWVPVQATPAPGEIVDLGDIVLRRSASVTGRIVDAEDRPLAGALVRAGNLPPMPFAAVPLERLRPDGAFLLRFANVATVLELPPWIAELIALLPIAQATSGADGRFEVTGLSPGNLTVAVTAPGRESLVRTGLSVAAEAAVHLGDLRLGDGADTRIVVTSADGTPVAGAEVLVAPQSVGPPTHVAERAGRTDAEGQVRVTGLPRGAALAAARRTDRSDWVLGEPAPADGTLRVVLPDLLTLTVRVLDPVGRPVADPRLRLFAGTVGAGAVELSMYGLGSGIELAGRIARGDDGRLCIRDLAPGSFCVVASAPGCALACVDVELRRDQEQEIQLRPARVLRVRTVDQAGEGVAGAVISVQPRGGSRPQRILDVPLAVGRTDAGGWCPVRDLPTEETRVTAAHPRHGHVHAVVAGAPAELVLQFLATGTIRGRLTDGGRPPAPGRWVAVLERRLEKEPRGALPDMPQLAVPGLDGGFVFAALQPGKYRITAQDSVTDVGTVGGLVTYLGRRKKIFPWNKADVELRGGETLDVKLDAMIDTPAYTGPGAVVTGTVTIDGAPAAGALVVGHSDVPDRNATSRVDRAGAFDLGHVPAGKLRVTVVPRGVAESRLLEYLFNHDFARDLVVAPGEPQSLSIEIVTGGVSGRVLDWNGAPVQGCRVQLFRKDQDGGSAYHSERSGGGGAFSFTGLPAGTWQLRALKEDAGQAVVEGIRIEAGGSAGPVVVTLAATARVSGRVDLRGLPGQAPAGIALVPVGGGEQQRGGLDKDGKFEFRNVAVGRYRVEVARWGGAVHPAGEVEVGAPAVRDLVLTVSPR